MYKTSKFYRVCEYEYGSLFFFIYIFEMVAQLASKLFYLVTLYKSQLHIYK